LTEFGRCAREAGMEMAGFGALGGDGEEGVVGFGGRSCAVATFSRWIAKTQTMTNQGVEVGRRGWEAACSWTGESMRVRDSE
jgi:hypothetical protein